MTNKARLTRLEKERKSKTTCEFIESRYDFEAWERSLNSLADALGDITGAEVTRTELDEALNKLHTEVTQNDSKPRPGAGA